MHIEIQQSTQHVAAARTRKFEPEEIDWILNKQQDRFVLACLRPLQNGGFELDEAGYSKIGNLVEPNVSLKAWIESAKTYKSYLPANLMYLVSDRSLVNNLCGAAPVVASGTLYRTWLRQDYSALTLGSGHLKYYYAMAITMPDSVFTVPTDFPYGNSYDGYKQKPDVVTFLVPWILWNKKNWYWAKFDDLDKPGHYIQVQETVQAVTASLTIDATALTPTSTIGTDTKTLTRHTNTGLETENRLTSSEKIATLNQAAFWRTAYYSPITERTGNILRTYRDESFIVSGTIITYVRKPRPISLSLNSDCEINPDYHQALCDLCVEYLKGRVENKAGKDIVTEDLDSRVVL